MFNKNEILSLKDNMYLPAHDIHRYLSINDTPAHCKYLHFKIILLVDVDVCNMSVSIDPLQQLCVYTYITKSTILIKRTSSIVAASVRYTTAYHVFVCVHCVLCQNVHGISAYISFYVQSVITDRINLCNVFSFVRVYFCTKSSLFNQSCNGIFFLII